MPRLTSPEVAPIYEAAKRWARDCVIADGSLSSPGRGVSTAENALDLVNRVMGAPELGKDTFVAK